jgi:ring-1,2-phenylacetyl-CoA epoxidase subunit PaaD
VSGPSPEVLRAALAEVEDPEIPIALADLGVIRGAEISDGEVTVVLAPTRLGCPALGEIARRVRTAALALDGVGTAKVRWEMRAWSPEDVSAEGRRALHDGGYGLTPEAEGCPHCGSTHIEPLSAFGGSVCRVPYACRGCGTPFDVLRSARCALLSGATG